MTPGRQRALIFTAAGLMAFIAVAGFGFLVWKSFDNLRNPADASGEERRLMVTTESLEPFGVENTGRRGETLKSVRQIDGTRDIEYVYSSKNDPQAGTSLYVFSKVQVLAISLSAMQLFKMEQLAIRATVGLGDKVKLRPRPDLLTAGDQRYAATIERDGKPTGNIFIIRQGRVVHTVTISGFAFEKPESAEQLFAEPLAESKRQFP
jgi:hypothetical protein